MRIQIKLTLPDEIEDEAKKCALHRGLTPSEYAKLATVQLIRRDLAAASKTSRRGDSTPND